MAATARTLWKGAISFGLVHIPVGLYTATQESELDFDWLDKRTMDPVGYKRINKRTGREITRENIVKGIAYEDGRYVLLSDDEIRAAYPESTQTIEIEAFVQASEIPFVYLERPYYLAPLGKGAKVYALLREALLKTGRVGIARVVIQTKQHLAALIPAGPGLILNLLRWADEIRSWENLDLPEEGSRAAGISPREMKMAEQLIDDMTDKWEPGRYQDEFKEKILQLVQTKIEAEETEAVTPMASLEESRPTADIVDLTELLKRSLEKNKGDAKSARGGGSGNGSRTRGGKTRHSA
ncbi:putative DNA repair protein YkoV [Pigmentiphaga humi]|uniref:Non-homologous end joining protein Ku n=1 Tax=Pigmentiphaga humi TaxID=2478468 RepID=A0A3P4B2N2_9BURK|nr:Ku protein [Pigmentiphaga humi]VCU70312.1 putative DNA repair protein YkoV [Pigmentiphaga humi]